MFEYRGIEFDVAPDVEITFEGGRVSVHAKRPALEGLGVLPTLTPEKIEAVRGQLRTAAEGWWEFDRHWNRFARQ